MQIKIIVYLDGVYQGSVPVNTPCLIGRSKDAGLPIPHSSVSRRHCELFEKDGQLYLQDLGSLNGTLFMGQFVNEPAVVQSGDEFVVNNILFRLEESVELTPDEHALDMNENAANESAMVTIVKPVKSETFDEEEMRASIRVVGDAFNE